MANFKRILAGVMSCVTAVSLAACLLMCDKEVIEV